jgi:hypothetical protein
VPYTVKLWQRRPDSRAPVALLEIHPLGKLPVIEDDGLVIAETGTIVRTCSPPCDARTTNHTSAEYLIQQYGADKIKIPDTKQARVDDLYCKRHTLFARDSR